MKIITLLLAVATAQNTKSFNITSSLPSPTSEPGKSSSSVTITSSTTRESSTSREVITAVPVYIDSGSGVDPIFIDRIGTDSTSGEPDDRNIGACIGIFVIAFSFAGLLVGY